MLEIEVSDWTALAIQEAYQKRKLEFEKAKETRVLAEQALQDAQKNEEYFAAGMAQLKADAKRLGVTVS